MCGVVMLLVRHRFVGTASLLLATLVMVLAVVRVFRQLLVPRMRHTPGAISAKMFVSCPCIWHDLPRDRFRFKIPHTRGEGSPNRSARATYCRQERKLIPERRPHAADPTSVARSRAGDREWSRTKASHPFPKQPWFSLSCRTLPLPSLVPRSKPTPLCFLTVLGGKLGLKEVKRHARVNTTDQVA